MHHAQIAQRAFDTPLMIAPAKALAFLSGLGPRITGQEIRFDGAMVAEPELIAARQTARASLIGGDLVGRPDRQVAQFAAGERVGRSVVTNFTIGGQAAVERQRIQFGQDRDKRGQRVVGASHRHQRLQPQDTRAKVRLGHGGKRQIGRAKTQFLGRFAIGCGHQPEMGNDATV